MVVTSADRNWYQKKDLMDIIVRHIPLLLFATFSIRKLLILINFSGIRYSHTKKQKELDFVKNVPEAYIS